MSLAPHSQPWAPSCPGSCSRNVRLGSLCQHGTGRLGVPGPPGIYGGFMYFMYFFSPRVVKILPTLALPCVAPHGEGGGGLRARHISPLPLFSQEMQDGRSALAARNAPPCRPAALRGT